MSFKVPNIPICVAVACCGVALIFQIVAVAGTGWVVSESGQFGLFRVCASGVCVEITSSLSSDWWKAVQAFSIMGLLTILGSLALGILHFFKENNKELASAGIACCCVSVIFLIIELAVFGAEMVVGGRSVLGTTQYGYGFILSVIACILSAIAAVLFGVGKRKGVYE
ncbi:hypothetical protein C0Q70_07504 [Pomacea canaliculata]|uniref:MARVEL domain-containing protein n=1 Tax=Pomacea canaliculata TaxID=400727 RepID=A0A2T7PF72_POMCA|nr:epithelial membrane protein 1-like [Pomacea canaliculata]PVD32076.1 hypothetical protein C0Q70_07504 [Pomacea canaliculata]